MATLNLDLPVYYQSKSKNNGCKFSVTVYKVTGAYAIVWTQGDTPVSYRVRVSSLFN